MDRLNCFNAYNNKELHHEDQLTRAYLILLKYSFHTFSAFLSYVQQENINDEHKINFLNLLEDENWNFETQRSNPNIHTNLLGSILMTDQNLEKHDLIQSSNRNARYDGLITFGTQLTLIIENKPRSQHVWNKQLNPSKENLDEIIVIMPKPIILEWKQVVKHLNSLYKLETVNGAEKMMINDFLNYIDHNFPFLNPYDSFKLCKSNTELLQRRIFNILKEISTDETIVEYHHGWGWYIETPPSFSATKKIGLILHKDETSWHIELSIYFGDTQTQTKSFYSNNPDISKLNQDWVCHPNFHVSFITSNLVWFHTNKELKSPDVYIDFWKQNLHLIHQHGREDVKNLLTHLTNENIIEYNEEEQQQMNYEFFDTQRKTLNICAGFGIISTLNSVYCEKNDNDTYLLKDIALRIQQGLSIIDYDVKSFIKAQYLV